MANIRKLSSGKWNVQVRRHGHPSVSKSFNVQADARKWAKDVEVMMDRGIFIDRSEAERTTLAEALDRYAKEITPLKKSKDREAVRIDQLKRLPLAKRSLASLKPSDWSQYRDERLAQGKATNTVRLELALVSHLFTIASKEWGIFLTNPLSLIRKPKPSKARTRRLEGDEYDRLLLHASSHLKPLIILAVETAMRLGELLSMKWENVDLKKRYVFLPDTKNGDSRIVPLSLLATKTLETYPKHIKEERVFYNWKASSDAIQCTWRSTLKKAGIEDLRFHDLRHHAISVMVEKGMNPLEVASISGHKTMQMLKRYTHLKVEDLVRKLG